MKRPSRRARPAGSGARRAAGLRAGTVRCAAIGLLAVVGPAPAARAEPASAPATGGGRCSGATLSREYTADAMTWRLHLDLDGCHWWNGSPRKLIVWLNRETPDGAADRFSMVDCTGDGDRDHPGAGCDATITLAHERPEQAVVYQGEATWQWRGGSRRSAFDTHCSTGADGRATCDDPVATWRA